MDRETEEGLEVELDANLAAELAEVEESNLLTEGEKIRLELTLKRWRREARKERAKELEYLREVAAKRRAIAS